MSSQPYPAAVGNDQKEPFYDPEFQSSVKKAEKLAKKLRGGLGECEIALKWGSRLHELYKEAMRLSVFKPTNPKLIGFVGNAGVGKVYLISSLCHSVITPL